jgi:ClpP class serine protease
MSFKTVSAILRGRWMLDKQWANDHLPLVVMLLKGQSNVSFVERSGSENGAKPFCIDPTTMTRYNMNVYTPMGNLVPNPNIPPNSVGILPVCGPITKYDGSCGEPGAISLTSSLMDLLKRDNIGSIIQLIDTPGGESRAANSYCSVAANSKKPILSYVDGMCASLGMYFASASSEVYMSNDLDQMGSIGSYCTLLDFSSYLEKEGIKMHEIYAPQSIDKNKSYRDALTGDYSAIEADLKKCVDSFIEYVAQSRGSKPAECKNEWNTGKMFYAKDAIKNGLADGVKPFDQVVSKAAWLAKRNKN